MARSKSKTQNHYPGKLRIIGGRWRGRTLPVVAGQGLRPTPNRIRETLFNWLQSRINGAHCLDLFAGTGALCLEALSRGAARVVMVESATTAVAMLQKNSQRLQANNVEVVQSDALTYLKDTTGSFDIIFVDPPFATDLIAPCLQAVSKDGWLRPDGLVYIEAPSNLQDLPLPKHWSLFRSKRSGQVGYHLAQPTIEK